MLGGQDGDGRALVLDVARDLEDGGDGIRGPAVAGTSQILQLVIARDALKDHQLA